MFAQWVTEGFAAGVRIWFAGAAVLGLTFIIIGIMGLGMALLGKEDEHDE